MIQIGNDKIKEIYVGSDKIKEVYYGSEKVWGEIEPPEVGYWVHKDTGIKTYFDLDDPSIENGIMSAPSWKIDCSEVQIPLGVTGLGYGCFADYSDLTSITLPEGLTSLGEWCFHRSTSLSSIDIPESVTNLGKNCFTHCASLTSINIPEGVTSLGDYCFNGCTSLTSINMPAGITSLGQFCFSSCPFDSVTLPESLTSLGQGCFTNCASLTSINIPAGVTSLEGYCFSNCVSLTLATVLPATPPSLGTYVFGNVHASFIIKVHSPYVNDYKTATNWTAHADIISAIESIQNGGWKHKDTGVWTEFAEFWPHYGESEGVVTFNGFASELPESIGYIAPNISELIIREGCNEVYNIGLIQNPDTQEWLYEHLIVMDFPSTITDIGPEGGSIFDGLANVEVLKIRATTPPAIRVGTMQSPRAKVYVPDAAVATYKSHPNTSPFAAIIFPLSDIE